MTKLMISLLCLLCIGAALLQLRQQKLNIRYETNRLHDQIEASQARLWNQQLQIAVYTSPNAITETIAHHNLNMTAPTPARAQVANWSRPTRIEPVKHP